MRALGRSHVIARRHVINSRYWVARMIVRSARGDTIRNGQCSSTTMGVSTMSDYERNVATAPFGQALGRAGTVAVDEGLRAYMLRIYNYMVLGLAITGAAALGI